MAISKTDKQAIAIGSAPVAWLTADEAAELLGYSDGSVLRHAIRRGDIAQGTDAVKRGGRWFIRADAARAYYEQMLAEFEVRRPPYRGPMPTSEPESS